MHIFRDFPVNGAGSDAQRLDAILADLTREHGVPAAQLAVHIDGRTMSVTASATGAHVESDAKIPVGSITKAFTAALAGSKLVTLGAVPVPWCPSNRPLASTEEPNP